MPSLLMSALPASIQSRIPKLPSIRRTVSTQPMFSRSEAVSTSTLASTISSPALSASPPSSACSSPPSSRPSTSAGMHSRTSSGKDTIDLGLVVSPAPRPATVESLPSDVNWKYAQNGFRNLQNALREAGDPDRLPELERQIYVESIAYLLRGLPTDLHDSELSQLRNASPEGLLSVPGPFPSSSLTLEQQLALQQHGLGIYGPLPPGSGSFSPSGSPRNVYYKTRSIPHVATHWVVTQIYALILVLIPILTDLVRWAIEIERKYHVPEAVLSFATALFLALYRNAAELYVAVCNMGDGSVGRALDDGTTYLTNGVASGFREAVLDVARGQR